MPLGVLLLVLLTAGRTFGSAEDDGAAVLQAARERADIFSQGPFLLRAKVEMSAYPGILGQYALIWNDQLNWREELAFADYREVHLQDEGRMWTYTTHPDQTHRTYSVFQLRNFITDLRPPPEVVPETVMIKKVKGVQLRCIRLSGAYHKHVRCVDDKDRYVGDLDHTTFGDFRRVGEKEFPFLWELPRKVRIIVSEITPGKYLNPNWRLVTPSFARKEGCFFLGDPYLLKKTRPSYPLVAKAGRIQGKVILQATVAPDGKVEDVQVRSGHPMLTGPSVEAVRQWRYTSPTCAGQPVSTVLPIEVIFTLR